MTDNKKRGFFNFWAPQWKIEQLKEAYVSMLEQGCGGMSSGFIGELSHRKETLTRDECIYFAVLHRNIGEVEEFLAYIKTALKQNPQDVELNFGLAQYFIETENYKELNRLVLHIESFAKESAHLYFLKGLCVLKLLQDFAVTRALWRQACMAGSDAACDGLKELDKLEMITKLDQQEAYRREIHLREQRLKEEFQLQKGTYSDQDFMKDLGGTAARAAMFSIIGGLVSSMFFGRGSA